MGIAGLGGVEGGNGWFSGGRIMGLEMGSEGIYGRRKVGLERDTGGLWEENSRFRERYWRFMEGE